MDQAIINSLNNLERKAKNRHRAIKIFIARTIYQYISYKDIETIFVIKIDNNNIYNDDIALRITKRTEPGTVIAGIEIGNQITIICTNSVTVVSYDKHIELQSLTKHLDNMCNDINKFMGYY